MKIFDAIYSSAGRFLTVEFIKADGTLRRINGRLGVTRHLAGGKCTLNKNKFIIFYDLKNKGYRAINKSAIVSVKTQNMIIYNRSLKAA